MCIGAINLLFLTEFKLLVFLLEGIMRICCLKSFSVNYNLASIKSKKNDNDMSKI